MDLPFEFGEIVHQAYFVNRKDDLLRLKTQLSRWVKYHAHIAKKMG